MGLFGAVAVVVVRSGLGLAVVVAVAVVRSGVRLPVAVVIVRFGLLQGLGLDGATTVAVARFWLWLLLGLGGIRQTLGSLACVGVGWYIGCGME
jgi:hypothetical protein